MDADAGFLHAKRHTVLGIRWYWHSRYRANDQFHGDQSVRYTHTNSDANGNSDSDASSNPDADARTRLFAVNHAFVCDCAAWWRNRFLYRNNRADRRLQFSGDFVRERPSRRRNRKL